MRSGTLLTDETEIFKEVFQAATEATKLVRDDFPRYGIT